LRPYQKEGFNWLNFLDDFKWGGILADDMGLGKTLQIITFLQHKANLANAKNEPRQTHLIVAPTSLIFNWENEVEKFAPTLKTLIYHGAERKNLGASDFETVDMVITTYTTAAADIEKFKNFRFGYAILDESQAIKNATTQRYKAMRLLQADNRICMSGTPVENNTFDLYGQFNFLNPGMLGSMEYFKDQYATPIDKENDSDASQELRRLVQPFMLRRTKELVASDLPEKTETVLYCEMGSKQRKLYDAYREKVRKQVLGEIDAKGLSSAAMIVLQGLLRLRQICDSPSLINDDEITEFEEESIKLKELKEHIIERTGNHKILIFSQFKGMLALIRNMLEHAKIPHLYLDGGTSPTDRRKAVDKFQTDDKYRVFLISLKAGGSGLNLTAADYVYLVDPWWNPAVEAQAIDRTHRIGQTNHVFAYKMICKDTVEEKILKLQEKKKALAADLVASETGMMKSLTRDDIAFLFS
jgi:SNF2 family DNA or RNA helicase